MPVHEHLILHRQLLYRFLQAILHHHVAKRAVIGARLAPRPIIVVVIERGPDLVPLLLLPLAAVYATAAMSLERERQAMHDVLTGLPNRKFLIEQAADAIDELLGTLLAARLRGDSPPEYSGTAVVSCTDGPQAWFVRLVRSEVPEVRSADRNERADARLSNRTANVLYQLRGRMQLTGEGDPTVLKGLRMS